MTTRTAAAFALLLALTVPSRNFASVPPNAAGEYSKHLDALRGLSVAVAEAMPAEQYAFRPHPESMNFGELISHIATTNYQFCAGLKDADPPALPSPTDKDAIVKFLGASFDYCALVIPSSRRSNSIRRTTLRTDGSPEERSCSRCTSTSHIIAVRPKSIFGTRASGRRHTGSEQKYLVNH